jgi:hypothetical protein
VLVTRTLAELVLLVALLVAAVLIVANDGRVAPADADRVPATGAGRDAAVDAGLPERAAALRAYLSSPPPKTPVRRNPFEFSAPPAAGRVGVGGAAEAASAGSPTRPPMELAGIAEDTGNGHPARTAVISAAGQVIFASEGDRILSRFLVVRIAADAVYLKDDEGGGEFSLVLK